MMVDSKRGSLKYFGKRGWRKNANYYTHEEDILIINEVLFRSEKYPIGGNNIWISIEEAGVIPDRTWQSLKERFRKTIVPRLHKYKISDSDKKILKAGLMKVHINSRRKKVYSLKLGRKTETQRLRKPRGEKSSSSHSSVEIEDDSDWDEMNHTSKANNPKHKKRKLFSEESILNPTTPIAACATHKGVRMRDCKVKLERLFAGEDVSASSSFAVHSRLRPQRVSDVGDLFNVSESLGSCDSVGGKNITGCNSQLVTAGTLEDEVMTDLCSGVVEAVASREKEACNAGVSLESQSGKTLRLPEQIVSKKNEITTSGSRAVSSTESSVSVEQVLCQNNASASAGHSKQASGSSAVELRLLKDSARGDPSTFEDSSSSIISFGSVEKRLCEEVESEEDVSSDCETSRVSNTTDTMREENEISSLTDEDSLSEESCFEVLSQSQASATPTAYVVSREEDPVKNDQADYNSNDTYEEKCCLQ
ncbi:uncharacterized protein LOC134542471 [Bacillus rossius redtenbacheri]|uniref:uncharacterized protein LOC134542471 n=1 Tax=Bacillus rossius redtenbacheri TaxID=93214 RepID=UPI002FDE09AE